MRDYAPPRGRHMPLRFIRRLISLDISPMPPRHFRHTLIRAGDAYADDVSFEFRVIAAGRHCRWLSTMPCYALRRVDDTGMACYAAPRCATPCRLARLWRAMRALCHAVTIRYHATILIFHD